MIKSKTSTWQSWKSMRERCNSKNHVKYNDYGGRGITICKEWQDSFDTFLEDMGEKPDKSYSIDRIDNNGNYEPSNCKWSTRKEQQNNRRNCWYITLNGETLTITQWSERMDIHHQVIRNRIKHLKWSEYDAVFTPLTRDKDDKRPEIIIKLINQGVSVSDLAYLIKCKEEYIETLVNQSQTIQLK